MNIPVTHLLEQMREKTTYRKHAVSPPVEDLRLIWALSQARGRIVILDSPQTGDPEGTKVGIIVSVIKGELVRVAMTRVEALNFARALVESVT